MFKMAQRHGEAGGRGQLRSPTRNIGVITQPPTKSTETVEKSSVSVGIWKVWEKDAHTGFSSFYEFLPEELTPRGTNTQRN